MCLNCHQHTCFWYKLYTINKTMENDFATEHANLSWEQKRFYKAICILNFGGCSNRNGQTKKKSCYKEKYSLRSCTYLSSSQERPTVPNFLHQCTSQHCTILSIFFVMLTKLGPFQGHHLFLKEKYSLKSCTYLCSHAVEYPSFEHHPQWRMEDFSHVVNPPGGNYAKFSSQGLVT